MGLDVYVESFTRYYAGDWETVVQKHGREQGLDVQVVRTNAPSEHPQLPRPRDHVEDWTADPAFQRRAESSFRTAFSQLLRDVEVSLPHDFSFCRQLDELNRRTWDAPDRALAEWRRDGAEYKAPLEQGARFAFSIMTELARQAVMHRLIMKMDY